MAEHWVAMKVVELVDVMAASLVHDLDVVLVVWLVASLVAE